MSQRLQHRLDAFITPLAALTDALVVVLAFILAYWIVPSVEGPYPIRYQALLLMWPLLIPAWFAIFGLYRNRPGEPFLYEARRLILVWIILCAVFATLALLTKTGAQFSRLWMGSLFLLCAAGFLMARLVFRILLGWLHRQGLDLRKIVLLGSLEGIQEVESNLQSEGAAGLQVISRFVVDSKENQAEVLKQLRSTLYQHSIDEVWIAAGMRAQSLIEEVLDTCAAYSVRVTRVPDLFGGLLVRQSLDVVAGLPVVHIQEEPLNGLEQFLKEIEDKILAFVICLILSPLFLLIALAIKLESPGPAIYRQMRHGWNGRPIEIYKFRSMVVHKDADGPIKLADRNDSRVTRVGRFLRRTSLDELPQFFNVLQGSMSIVGPRPHPVSLEEEYHSYTPVYPLRYKVKPGITGWAQVNGYRGNTDTPDKLRKRVEHDIYYIEHWSFWLDLRIIFLTVFRGFWHENAF